MMDAPDIPDALLQQFHKDLRRVHSLLGTFGTVEKFLRADPEPVRRVLDIGCGAGDLLIYLRRRMGVEVVGVDPKPGGSGEVTILPADAVSQPLPQVDVAVCTMLCHHLTPEENIALIRNVGRSARRFVILDLIRHPLPLALFSAFICPLIGHEAGADGRQSIRRAFTPPEFRKLAEEALDGMSGLTAPSVTIDVPLWQSRQVVDIRFHNQRPVC